MKMKQKLDDAIISISERVTKEILNDLRQPNCDLINALALLVSARALLEEKTIKPADVQSVCDKLSNLIQEQLKVF